MTAVNARKLFCTMKRTSCGFDLAQFGEDLVEFGADFFSTLSCFTEEVDNHPAGDDEKPCNELGPHRLRCRSHVSDQASVLG